MSADVASPLVEDAWLSSQLQRRAYHLLVRPDNPPSETVAGLKALPPSGYFVDAKVPITSTEHTTALITAGFTLVETAVTLDLEPEASISSSGRNVVREGRPSDSDGVAAVARNAFEYSRFHTDPQIERSRADALKAEWATNYFRGQRGQAMVVAESGCAVVGFLQLLVTTALTIDLIGVSAAARRRGVARDMIAYAVEQVRPADAPTVVGTQISNIPSLRLYEELGFRIRGARNVLHLHPRASVL